LQHFEWQQPRVGVPQAHLQPDGDQIVFQVLRKRPAIGVRIKRPAGGMYYLARTRLRRVDSPEFFDANGIALRVFALIKLEAFDELTTQLTPRAFGKHRVARM